MGVQKPQEQQDYSIRSQHRIFYFPKIAVKDTNNHLKWVVIAYFKSNFFTSKNSTYESLTLSLT